MVVPPDTRPEQILRGYILRGKGRKICSIDLNMKPIRALRYERDPLPSPGSPATQSVARGPASSSRGATWELVGNAESARPRGCVHTKLEQLPQENLSLQVFNWKKDMG